MNAATQLRQLLARPEIVVAPGAYDGLTARLVQQAGFGAVYMTGAGTAAARGFPDFGLLGMSEMVENAAVLARSVDIPLIADADTGYGNELNVTRTVREFESRNVAAIHIEDQVFSKRCGHLDGKEIVERNEFLAKIRAAVAARRHPDFTIIARTDARAVVSLDEAITRANLALEAGADMAFVEAPQTREEVATIPREVSGPCLLNLVPTGRTPLLPFAEAGELGYRMVILPGLLLKATIEACDAVLQDVQREGQMPAPRMDATVAALFRRLGADEWSALRQHFQQSPQE
ncbi:isocitrate lyase/PEP mutase family protein [Cupriavidus metallidurans]|uniref:isocitrate lyase/PEP mutase family protein n=1 Tax=Cupriavidus metallidurans TaxID=119219 RepID=UPI001BFCCBCE|nr:isocitrate lyase/PEP mutase family protein [Cupriavidus metallidurans]QWC92058.1 isocitrate lyase/PEP mutase family protein [Cupriavidus metallidurans]